MNLCYLGLGSNLKFPQRQLIQATKSIRALPKTHIVALSSVYATQPLSTEFQPQYANQVVAIRTALSPHSLLKYCQGIENKHQRVRKKRWGSRTLDIDILLFEAMVIDTPQLSIPHPEMLNRDFVLTPLREIIALNKR